MAYVGAFRLNARASIAGKGGSRSEESANAINSFHLSRIRNQTIGDNVNESQFYNSKVCCLHIYASLPLRGVLNKIK